MYSQARENFHLQLSFGLKPCQYLKFFHYSGSIDNCLQCLSQDSSTECGYCYNKHTKTGYCLQVTKLMIIIISNDVHVISQTVPRPQWMVPVVQRMVQTSPGMRTSVPPPLPSHGQSLSVWLHTSYLLQQVLMIHIENLQ